MGGVIARKYLIEEIKSTSSLKIRGILFYAAPHSGSDLAKWSDLISWRHWQMKQLRKGSEVLKAINAEWQSMNCAAAIATCDVVGGQDQVIARGENDIGTHLLASEDHRSIVKPTSKSDGSYLIFESFVLQTLATSSAISPNPLFDIYHSGCEPYYVIRREDFIVSNYLDVQNVWLFGKSGVGKTAALMRSLTKFGSYKLVSLGHYAGGDSRALYCALYENILGTHETRQNVESLNWPDLLRVIVLQLEVIAAAGRICILIEEMPLSDAKELQVFFSKLGLLLTLYANRNIHRTLTFAFSSICDPRPGLAAGGRIWEMLVVREFGPWRTADLERLVDTVSQGLGKTIAPKDRRHLVTEASGSPRFVKIFFRNYVNLSAFIAQPRLAFDEALEITRLEMIS